MFLRKISLRNFKSFKRAEIKLDYPFTAITGPNGSGKSNIVDSILFCLGLTSSKTLRADKLTDLIKIGCDEAEVELEFENGLKIRRRVKRTGKGYYSYYYIDGKSVSYTEVERTIERLELDNDYNIVMQGDVTRIAEMSPVQRRKIIDDIAGISEFDEKKEKAMQELEVVREKIEKLDAVIAEVSNRLEALRRDREEALRYKALLEEKEKLETFLKAHRYRKLKEREDALKGEIEALELEKDDAARELVQLNFRIQELNEEAKRLTEELAKIKDERIGEIQREILNVKSEIEAIKKSKGIYEDEIAKLENERMRLLIEIAKLKEELEGINIEELMVQRASVASLVEEIEKRMEDLKREIDSLGEEYRKVRNDLEEKRKEIERLKEIKGEKIRERDKAIEGLRRIEMEIDDLRIEKEKLNVESLFEVVKDKRTELERKERELKALIDRRNELDVKLFGLRDELANLEEKLKEAEIELTKVRTELSAMDRFSKPVEIVLEAKERGELRNIYGTVAQLGEVEENFALALEVAGGNALQFLVVETEDDAVEAIKYLKRVEGGRASFIPLRKIRGFKVDLDRSVLNERGVIDYAVNLIRCDPKFRPVFEFVYRDTLVVDNIDTARRLMDGRRIVTLDGDLIEKSGVMTGGSVQKRRSGILISKELVENEKSLRRRIEELKRRKEEIFKELRKIEDSRRNVQMKIDALKEDISKLKGEISIIEAKIEDSRRRADEIKLKLAEKREEMKELYRRAEAIEGELEVLEEKIARIEKEIEELSKMLSDSKLVKLNEELERLREDREKNREILMRIEASIREEKIRKENIEGALKEKERRVGEIAREIEDLKRKKEECEEEKRKLERRLEELVKEEERIGREAKILRTKRDEILDEMRKLEEEKTKVELGLRTIDDRIEIKSRELEEVSRELEGMEKVDVDELPPLAVVERGLREVEAQLSEFGDVNMKAIQEYEDVKARRDDLLEKRNVLHKEREEIMERIRRYERMKREAFFRVFEAINRNFREIVKELANGEGELYLDGKDPFESGLHIRFKPFGKKVQKLEAMSGGEKSLVALAFIFAIQRYKPAPFYVFDEVDMFLDGVNVGRVAKMIKRLSKDAQFIVVSLRKPMLEMADAVIGITRGGESSIVTAIRLR